MPTQFTFTRPCSKSSIGRLSSGRDNEKVQVAPESMFKPPEPGEWLQGHVIAYPGQVTRVRVQFNTPGQFVWHCHIVEHEDNEMMRPFRIGPFSLVNRASLTTMGKAVRTSLARPGAPSI